MEAGITELAGVGRHDVVVTEDESLVSQPSSQRRNTKRAIETFRPALADVDAVRRVLELPELEAGAAPRVREGHPLAEEELDGLKARPEAGNLVGIYAAVAGTSVEQVLSRFAGQGFGTFKPALADAVIALLDGESDARARYEAEFTQERADQLLADWLTEAAG